MVVELKREEILESFFAIETKDNYPRLIAITEEFDAYHFPWSLSRDEKYIFIPTNKYIDDPYLWANLPLPPCNRELLIDFRGQGYLSYPSNPSMEGLLYIQTNQSTRSSWGSTGRLSLDLTSNLLLRNESIEGIRSIKYYCIRDLFKYDYIKEDFIITTARGTFFSYNGNTREVAKFNATENNELEQAKVHLNILGSNCLNEHVRDIPIKFTYEKVYYECCS